MRGLLALFLVAVLGGSAAAQTVAVGVHGGVNLGRIDSDRAVETEFTPKPVFGAQVELGLFQPLTLRVEVEYASKGGKVTTTTAGGPTVEYSLSYLALPVNLRYDLGAGATEAYVFAGTTLGALVAANQRRAGTSQDVDVKDQLAGVEITLDLGAGIGYRITPNVSVFADVRYSLGLNQVAKGDAVVDINSWKTTTIQIVGGVSYTFGAGAAPGPVPIVARRR